MEIGRFAMVGMGSVVSRSVPDFYLVMGNPARARGCVCRCGQVVLRFEKSARPPDGEWACPDCGLRFALKEGIVRELNPPV